MGDTIANIEDSTTGLISAIYQGQVATAQAQTQAHALTVGGLNISSAAVIGVAIILVVAVVWAIAK